MLKGRREPRIFTPPLRDLEPRTPETEARTLGYAVIDFAREVLRKPLFPWQEWFFIHALELLPEGGLRFKIILLLVARQSGKSTISQVLGLFVLYVLEWKLVLGTAQDLDTAEEVMDGAIELITAIYKSGAENREVKLPIGRSDPFYTVEGIMAGVPRFYKKTASVMEQGGDITLGSSYEKKGEGKA